MIFLKSVHEEDPNIFSSEMDVRDVHFITILFILVQSNSMSCQFHIMIGKNFSFLKEEKN